MLIKKFSKLKDGMYKLSLEDNLDLKVHEDLILKYSLLLTKNIDEETLESILEENKVYETYNVALKYIKTRLRSIKEIKEYLTKKGYSEEHINSSLEKLKSQGYLNDSNYARSLINDRINMSSYGPLKIKKELLDSGISSEIIDEYLMIFDKELENIRIEKIIKKQINVNHNKSNMILKKKIQSYLISLGYSSYLINKEISKISSDDKDILKKEYEKLHKKLSRKYSDKELEYKIKQKLYQKGFTSLE